MTTVLQVIDTTGPGGAETIFCCLCEQAGKSGYRVIALVRGKGWLYSELRRREIETHIIDCKGSFNVRYLVALIRFIRKRNIDVVHAHLLGSAVYASLAAAITRVKTIATFHGHVDISDRERFLGLKAWVVRTFCSNVVAVSEKLTMTLLAAGIARKENVVLIHNGIDIGGIRTISKGEEQKAFRARFGIADDEVLVGALGNIRKAKNYQLAVDAVHALRSSGVKIRFMIAGHGEGELLSQLEAQIEKYGLNDSVTLLGFVSDTNEFLRVLDIFLMTSISEGQPLALLQAMSYECAIVSTPSGVEDIIKNGQTGIIADGHDVDSVSRAIVQLCNDPELGAKLGARAKEVVTADYSVAVMFNAYCIHYR